MDSDHPDSDQEKTGLQPLEHVEATASSVESSPTDESPANDKLESPPTNQSPANHCKSNSLLMVPPSTSNTETESSPETNPPTDLLVDNHAWCSSTEEPSQFILIVGETGSGKSACANVLTGITEEPIFTENPAGNSNNPTIHDVDVNMNEGKMKLRIIEAVGFCHFPFEEAMTSLASICKDNPLGFHHIFFVMRYRFEVAIIASFKAIYDIIFDRDPGALNHTTIIRPESPFWRNPTICEEDRQQLSEICCLHSVPFKDIDGVIHLNCLNEESSVIYKEVRQACHERLIRELPDASIGRFNLSHLLPGMDDRITKYQLTHCTSTEAIIQQHHPLSNVAKEPEAAGNPSSLKELLSGEHREGRDDKHPSKAIDLACKTFINKIEKALGVLSWDMKGEDIQSELRLLFSTDKPEDSDKIADYVSKTLKSKFEEMKDFLKEPSNWHSETSSLSLSERFWRICGFSS